MLARMVDACGVLAAALAFYGLSIHARLMVGVYEASLSDEAFESPDWRSPPGVRGWLLRSLPRSRAAREDELMRCRIFVVIFRVIAAILLLLDALLWFGVAVFPRE